MSEKKDARPADGPHGKTADNPRADEKPKRRGKDFGLEGTNKTVATPQPDNAQPADELQGTKSKFIPKTPYTRG